MEMTEQPEKQGCLAGVDFGTVRIGVALCDAGRTIASPLTTYARSGEQADGRFFCSLAEQEEIVGWVVGLPVHLSGEESQKSREAREFGQWLGKTTGLNVEFFDERFTTSQAEEFLLDAQLTNKRRKARRDMLAAQIMLTAYLESEEKGSGTPGALDD